MEYFIEQNLYNKIKKNKNKKSSRNGKKYITNE